LEFILHRYFEVENRLKRASNKTKEDDLNLKNKNHD